MADLLDIRNLSVAFDTDSGKVYAVNNLSLKIGRKETLGLVGETGAGKTTITNLINRFYDIDTVASGQDNFGRNYT